MTGNIVSDFFLYLIFAGIGGAITYGVWRLLLEKPKPIDAPRRHRPF